MRIALVAASIIWPVLMGTALWQRTHDQASVLTAGVHIIASTLCHRLPERSFHTAGVQWPVCGRCTGLYLAAPVGAVLGLFLRRRRTDRAADPRLLIIAAAPAVVTLLLEWLQIYDVGNVGRALSAVPIGAAAMLVIVRMVDRLTGHAAAGARPEGRGQPL